MPYLFMVPFLLLNPRATTSQQPPSTSRVRTVLTDLKRSTATALLKRAPMCQNQATSRLVTLSSCALPLPSICKSGAEALDESRTSSAMDSAACRRSDIADDARKLPCSASKK